MEPHITITYGWSDDDVAELTFEVCDGGSQFVNSAYVGLRWPKEQSAGLATFSGQVHGGIYNLEAGDRGPEYARGAFEALSLSQAHRTLHLDLPAVRVL